MLLEKLNEIVRHMEWADALVWNSVLSLPEAGSDARLRDCLYHVHTVHWAYLQIWRDDRLEIPDAASFEDLGAIHAWGRDYYRQASAYLENLDPETLQRRVHFPWSQQLVERWGVAQPATLMETILQVALHSTYHRGQVNTRLRELGAEPPLTDFIAWIWMGRPAAEW